MSLKRVDQLDTGPVHFADGDLAGVVADEDVLGLLVVLKAGAPRVAHVAADPPTGFRAVKLEISGRKEVRSCGNGQAGRHAKKLTN